MSEPSLILCPVNAIPTWRDQIEKWLVQEQIPEDRPYQPRVIAKCVQMGRLPLLAPMGSGKTRMMLQAYRERGHPYQNVAVAHGEANKGKRIREKVWANRKDFDIIITTPASFQRDAKAGLIPKDLPAVLWDEPHRYIRNRKAIFAAASSHFLHSQTVIMGSGTFLRKGPENLWPALHIANRKFFSSYWQYVHTWCEVEDGNWGKVILGPKNQENFKKYIYERFCAYVTDAEVEPYLPKKQRIAVPLEPTAFQQNLIDEIDIRSMVQIDEDTIKLVPSSMTKILRYRQILCTPKILNPRWERGACLEWILEALEEAPPRPVIFVPFVQAIPHVVAAIQEEFEGRKVWTLQGGMSHQDVQHIVKSFRESEDDVMVCSISYAEAFELHTSSVAFFLGYDWSPDVCAQAEDRLRRLTSTTDRCTYYYPKHIGTVEATILSVLDKKTRDVRSVTPQ